MPTNIGLPSVNITFKELASTAIQRGNTGIVAMILKDANSNGLHEIQGTYDIPSELSEDNQKYIKLALLGNVNTPSKVKVYVLPIEGETQTALDYLETVDFNYLIMPKAIKADNTAIKTFIEKMRNEIKFRVKAILANEAGDNEAIINSTMDNIEMVEGTIPQDEFVCVVAGLIAGTPLTQSVTNAIPKNVLNIPSATKASMETRVKNGELVLIKDAGKIRVARGVNSFVTTTAEKGQSFSKIKLVDTMDLIHNDIRKTCVDTYIGKVPNNYDNKCVLITAIKGYLEELAKAELIERDYEVEIDLEAQRSYLKSLGVDIANMKEQEIKTAKTKDKVFLKASIKLIDAIESINLEFLL